MTVGTLALPPFAGAVLANLGTAVGSLATVVCLAWTGWRARGADRHWRVLIGLALGPLAFVLAWHIRQVLEHGPSVATGPPETSNVFLLIIGLALAGVLSFPTDSVDATDRRVGTDRVGRRWYVITVLDSLVVVGSVALLAWSILLGPLVAPRRVDTAGLLSAVGATVGFLILLAGILLLASFRRPRSGLALALLGAGLGAMMLYAAIYALVIAKDGRTIPPPVDLLAVAGWQLVFLACLVPVPALAPPAPRRTPRTLWAHAALPYLALGVAGGLAASQLIIEGAVGRVETYGLLGLLLVITVRQMMMLGENTRLLVSVRASRQELHHQAFHDPLTGLANRALFADRLEQALAFRDGRPFALAYCDLDDFKRVNDTLGHGAGDELLRTTATRLRAAVQPGDTVARLGGDEFALLLESGRENPEAVCRRLAATIRAPCTLAGRSRPVGASFGLVIADPKRHPMADSLLRDADLAMYAAKREGKGGLVAFRPDLSTPESAPQARADLERALRGDDPDNLVEVRYTPVVDLHTWRTVAVEATPRWVRGHTREYAPEPLYRLADEAGLTMPLLDLILRQVCCGLATRGPARAPAPVLVAVPMNRDLEESPVAGVADLLADHSLPARSIALTLTSGGGLPNLTVGVPVLRRLADRGVRLVLDGVGGDRSTFAAWRALPVDLVRLDRCLTHVGDASSHGRAYLVREAVLAATARLDLTVIATDIGDAAEARELASVGCHHGTGPLYGPPRRLDETPAITGSAPTGASFPRVPGP
ncbi:putative bifunctional diguanylate cyclase/phosphodiesterase [Frankia nepalensis]|uniref:putative bifunctional diguanylate cyclase/phosphodiesterase n=1 Tax=Frankia nepalensis TaxID=1836974 RepID=UPI0027DD7AE8|nr:diguanylate cyclase [Frankia nepalensis]